MAEAVLDKLTDPKTPQGEVHGWQDVADQLGITDANVIYEKETSPEQWGKDAAAALAEKYERYGVKSEDFIAVTYEKDGVTYETVVYAGANGIDLGDPEKDFDPDRSWRSVKSTDAENTARHTVTIGGTDYDARKGMTYELYKPLVAANRKVDCSLPDSQMIENNSRNKWYRWTMMTGEGLGPGGLAPFAGVDVGGSVRRDWTDVDYVNLNLRFRPAVVRKKA